MSCGSHWNPSPIISSSFGPSSLSPIFLWLFSYCSERKQHHCRNIVSAFCLHLGEITNSLYFPPCCTVVYCVQISGILINGAAPRSTLSLFRNCIFCLIVLTVAGFLVNGFANALGFVTIILVDKAYWPSGLKCKHKHTYHPLPRDRQRDEPQWTE